MRARPLRHGIESLRRAHAYAGKAATLTPTLSHTGEGARRGVIVEQQREIAEMQAGLARRCVAAPAGGQPRHIMGAESYRSRPEEPGTRAELVGKSWAPGAGVPTR